MPDTFSNPYAGDSPIGAALKNLSSVITRGPNEAQNILRAEAALKLKQQRENTAGLGDMFRNYGTPAFDPGVATDMAIRGNVSPANLGGYDRYNAATRFGAADPRTTNAAVGAGEAYGSTAGGFREGQAGQDRRAQMAVDQRDREFNNTQVPIQTPTGPVYSRRSEAIGQPAVASLADVKGGFAQQSINNGGLEHLNPTERQFVGAEGAHGTPRMWKNPDGSQHMTLDNRTDYLTGEPLTPGGGLISTQGTPEQTGLATKVRGNLQESNIANERLKRLGSYAQSLISPQNVGATGFVKGFAQDTAQLASNLAQGLGYNGLNDAIHDMQTRAQAQGINPNSLPGLFTFDPNLPKVETAYDMLVMAAADAFAGGTNKASDRDIKIMRDVVGSPKDLFASPQSLTAKMEAVNDIIGINQGINADQLRGGDAPQAPAAPAPGVAPSPAAAPGAPTSDPLADARAAIAKGADPNAVRQRLQQHGINPAGL